MVIFNDINKSFMVKQNSHEHYLKKEHNYLPQYAKVSKNFNHELLLNLRLDFKFERG